MPVPVLYVIDSFKNPQAGTEGQLYQLIEGLDRNRFSPHLLVFRESPFLRENHFPCDYSVLGHAGLTRVSTWWALWREARRFRRQGGKIVHAFFIDPSIMCPIIFRWYGVRVIISRRDMGYWYTKGYLYVLRQSGRMVSAVIANSKAVKDIVVQKERISAESVHVIYNGYKNRDSSGALPEELSLLRRSYPEAVIAVIVANIRPLKRIEDAIQALSAVQKEGGDMHLAVIGGGDSGGLKNLATKLDVSERVHFYGVRQDVEDCLQAFDIGLLCSESEGFSNSIIEYMRAGLPVVCSSVGGNPEAIDDGISGYLYAVGDIASLSGKLLLLVRNRELRESMGAMAMESSRSRFSSESMVQMHQDVYKELSS